MAKLLMLQGLPASGKSTFAKELVKEGWVRTNKDDLRKLLHGGKWSKGNENQVVAIRDSIIIDALTRGRNVVVDDTNYHPKHEERLRDIATATAVNIEFEVKEFDTDVEECIKRDLHRGEQAVGEQVIRKMWREFVDKPWPEPIVQNDMPNAVIFDIDGTLAKMNGRGPFEWDKVGTDTVVRPVANLVEIFRKSGYKILIFSGRDGICEEETAQWLIDNNIKYDVFAMRDAGDTSKDVFVKQQLYNAYCNDFNIQYAVDDRPQVCRLWYELGLCLLKVGDPDLEF